MSTTMRSTLQTVPESLPADHVTNSAASAATPVVAVETKTHHSTTTTPAAIKTRSSSSAAKVSDSILGSVRSSSLVDASRPVKEEGDLG